MSGGPGRRRSAVAELSVELGFVSEVEVDLGLRRRSRGSQGRDVRGQADALEVAADRVGIGDGEELERSVNELATLSDSRRDRPDGYCTSSISSDRNQLLENPTSGRGTIWF